MSLRICVLGSTLDRAQSIMLELAKANREQITKRDSEKIELIDGTAIKTFSVNRVKYQFDGELFGQVFFDAQIHPRSILACRDTVYVALMRSCVPERYRFQPIYSCKGRVVHND